MTMVEVSVEGSNSEAASEARGGDRATGGSEVGGESGERDS